MAYTTPATITAGQVATASWANVNVRDNISWIATDSPACRAYNNANISHTSSGNWQTLTLNSERFDNAAVHSTSSNTSRLTVPTGGGGKYLFGAGIEWANNATGRRGVQVLQNATTALASISYQVGSDGYSDNTTCAVYALVAADYVEMQALQGSGGALNVLAVSNYSPEFWMFWIRT